MCVRLENKRARNTHRLKKVCWKESGEEAEETMSTTEQ